MSVKCGRLIWKQVTHNSRFAIRVTDLKCNYVPIMALAQRATQSCLNRYDAVTVPEDRWCSVCGQQQQQLQYKRRRAMSHGMHWGDSRLAPLLYPPIKIVLRTSNVYGSGTGKTRNHGGNFPLCWHDVKEIAKIRYYDFLFIHVPCTLSYFYYKQQMHN